MTWALFLVIHWEFLHLDFLNQDNGWLLVMSKKLELEHLPMNSDRKSQKKKAWKYLKQQQVIGIIVLLFVLVTDSWSGVKKKKKTNLIGSAQEKFIRCYTTHQCKHSCSVDSFPQNNSRIQPLLSCTLAPFQPRSSVSSWQRKKGRNCPLASSQLFLEITHIPCAYIPFVQISFFLPFSPSLFHHLYFLFFSHTTQLVGS